jgi:LCP family protein required for cell wall assembly
MRALGGAWVRWRRLWLAGASIVVLSGLLGLRWVVETEGPVRNREVVTELSKADGGSRIFVVVGSDSRQSIGADPEERFGPRGAVTTEWADVVMLVRLESRTGRVRILSLPRELLVDVDGQQKLGATLESGGPRAVVRAVRWITGVAPNHYVQIDFFAFAQLVDRLGGVTIDIPLPARDIVTGLSLDAGPKHLDGEAALAYARSRSYEELHDDGWRPLDDGDLGRISRQHRLLQGIAVARATTPLFRQLSVAPDVARHVKVDAGLSVRELVGLARSFTSSPIAQQDIGTLPTIPLLDEDIVSPFEPPHVGAVSYLVPEQPAASRALADFVAA